MVLKEQEESGNRGFCTAIGTLRCGCSSSISISDETCTNNNQEWVKQEFLTKTISKKPQNPACTYRCDEQEEGPQQKKHT